MEVLRYKYIFIVLALMTTTISSKELHKTSDKTCPFSKIIEDIFKVNKNQGNSVNNSERAKLFLHSIANITSKDDNVNQEKLVDDIIAAINRIKNNMTAESSSESKLNEAIILSPEGKDSEDNNKVVTQIKSGIEDKIDILNENNIKQQNSKNEQSTTERGTYVEILTIEPNNTHKNVNVNVTSASIIEVLKHLMPMFNTTVTKKLHNITIIEKNINRNHSYFTTKNVSTIVVTYCDKDNSTSSKVTTESVKTADSDDDYDYYGEDSDEDDEEESEVSEGDKREVLEAAEYGMKKMHELYSVLEPKLYSMGFWLDNNNPARYVAAFNAPSEDSARYFRYGYASLQAAAKLKELISLTIKCSGFLGNEVQTGLVIAHFLRGMTKPIIEL